jgi:hypothetical protein
MATAKFNVIRHQPYPHRSEHVNIGVVVYLEDGSVRVRMANNLRKLKAFDPSADIETVRDQESALQDMLNEVPYEKKDAVATLLGPWRLDGMVGTLSYHSKDSLEDAIGWALYQTCETITSRRYVERRPQSRLLMDLKKTFSIYGWLAHEPRQISQKLIVHKYPLMAEEGLVADFAVRSDKLSVIETLDMRYFSNPSLKRTEGIAKAMVLSVANGLEDTLACSIVAGSQTDCAKEMTKLLSRISSRFYVYESTQDMNELFRDIGNATGKPVLDLPV